MKIFTGIVLLTCAAFYIGNVSAAVTYKASVDYDYGFYKVIGSGIKPATDTEPSSTYFVTTNYTKQNLTINVGDTVIWINYDPKDWQLTIISEQGLWSERNSRLKWSYQKFNYTFTEPGIYSVYVKENDKLHQTIIVNPIEMPVIGIVKTPEPIETPVTTPVINITQAPVVPTKTPTNTTPGFSVIGVVMAILLTLYFRKNVNRKIK